MNRTTVAAALAGTGVALVLAQPASAAETAPVYQVTQEGMTADEGAKLAEAYRIPNALQENGAFGYVGEEFAQVPTAPGRHRQGRGRPARPSRRRSTRRALAKLKPIGADEALERASKLTELLGLSWISSSTRRSRTPSSRSSDRAGKPTSEYALDTTVSHDLTLGGLPATGQGAKLRITFAPDGTVTQLSSSLRKLEQAGEEPIIPSDEARKACEALYDDGVRQGEPTLGYLLPALGAVETIYPSYTCNPSSEHGEQAHLPGPGRRGRRPEGDDRGLAAAARRSSARPSPAARLRLQVVVVEHRADRQRGRARSPTSGAPRGKTTDAETVTLEVTDRNGLTATASVTLDGDGTATAETTPGGGGFGKLAIGPTDVGIEQTVDEWQCAQDSAIGFKNVMASHAIPTAFDWRGWAAFEKDFKEPVARRLGPPLRRQRRRPVVHRPRLVRRLHVQERDRRHRDHAGRRPLGRPRPRVDAARVLPGAARHQRHPRLLRPLGRSRATACTC